MESTDTDVKEKKKWYNYKWAVRLLLIIFYPVGLYGFIRGEKPIIMMILTTLLYGGFWTLVILSPSTPPEERVVNITETEVADGIIPHQTNESYPSEEKVAKTTEMTVPNNTGSPQTKESVSRTVAQSVPSNMVRIKGGNFMMGRLPKLKDEPVGSDAEGPQHQVTISSFYMGKYEITQKEWYEVMGTTLRQKIDGLNQRTYTNQGTPDRPIRGEGDNYPMYYVDWYDAIEYCNRRSQRDGLTPAYTVLEALTPEDAFWKGVTSAYSVHSETVYHKDVTWNRNANGYRLPTEAEWEYACRAGTKTMFNTGKNITTSQANYNGNYPLEWMDKWGKGGTTPRESTGEGQCLWGVSNRMHGVCMTCTGTCRNGVLTCNVQFYPSKARTDPVVLPDEDWYSRVTRGGSWVTKADDLRSAYRGETYPIYGFSTLGFRLARNYP
jgi:formylglycine-generating enzyme required for sulfatase activity